MRKPESSAKRRKASLKRANKRNRRNLKSFKKNVTTKKLAEREREKTAAEKKFKQHLSDLLGKKQ